MSTLKYWVWLSTLTDLAPKTRYELLSIFGDPEPVYYADDKQLLERCRLSERDRALLSDKSLARTNEVLEKCRQNGVTILTLRDTAYPARLKNIFDPPVVLYVKGRLPAIDEEAAIAVVGTRDATDYGRAAARRIAGEITAAGGLVVTGLARGIDSMAADGALRAGGVCVGVLGCAIDQVFPAQNAALYSDVAAAGALISEYPQGTEGAARFFPERNRIMSGLSVGALVVEAPARSGALITANLALEQGREVFAVPGNIDAPNASGPNKLIREGATLITSGWDLLEEFERQFPDKLKKPEKAALAQVHRQQEIAPKRPAESEKKQPSRSEETGRGFLKLRVQTGRKRIDNKKTREYSDLREQLSGLTERQLKIVSAMDRPSMHVDDIIDITDLPASSVNSELTILQIKGFVSAEAGKRFTLNVSARDIEQ